MPGDVGRVEGGGPCAARLSNRPRARFVPRFGPHPAPRWIFLWKVLQKVFHTSSRIMQLPTCGAVGGEARNTLRHSGRARGQRLLRGTHATWLAVRHTAAVADGCSRLAAL